MTAKQEQAPQKDRYVDKLFQVAEQLSANFSLFPEYEDNAVDHRVKGLVSPKKCDRELERLTALNIDNYIEQVVAPSEVASRTSAKGIVKHLVTKIITEYEDGPLYSTEAELDFGGHIRRVGIICQNREHAKGVWGPQHHNMAAQIVRKFARQDRKSVV